ncbi:hypothetical protein [Lysobacter antibioticus]|uniref:hypothetical protein n=1 Tax=Lysobacter antibioticus TaxID=84531 RepID=UPI00126A757E|nr:hypothetical protein [Lysobacter antibioticus]
MSSTPISSAPMTPEPSELDTARTAPAGWWRRNALWLLGTLVFGAWAIYAPYREALQAYQNRHPSHAIDVPKGEWAQYEGARWRLVSAEALAPRDPRIGGPLRKDAGVLLLQFEVIADSGTQAKALDLCKGQVSDAQGRLWDANPTGLPRLSGAKLPNTCGSGYDAQYKSIIALPGRPFRFQHAYLLPRTQRLEGLQARIDLRNSQTSKGRYLRFAL